MSLEVLCNRCNAPRPSLSEPCPCGSGKMSCAFHGDYDGERCLACMAMTPAEHDVALASRNERRAWDEWQRAMGTRQKAEQALLNERMAKKDGTL